MLLVQLFVIGPYYEILQIEEAFKDFSGIIGINLVPTHYENNTFSVGQAVLDMDTFESIRQAGSFIYLSEEMDESDICSCFTIIVTDTQTHNVLLRHTVSAD